MTHFKKTMLLEDQLYNHFMNSPLKLKHAQKEPPDDGRTVPADLRH
jgi:hypothetical protein